MGETKIRYDERTVKLTPLSTLTFYLTPSAVFESVARPARAVASSNSLEEANTALNALDIKTELDLDVNAPERRFKKQMLKIISSDLRRTVNNHIALPV
jgi:hypothetical protein